MLAGQTLAQDEGVLRADDDDQGQPEAESGAGSDSGRTMTLLNRREPGTSDQLMFLDYH